jgi:hypothetical protein
LHQTNYAVCYTRRSLPCHVVLVTSTIVMLVVFLGHCYCNYYYSIISAGENNNGVICPSHGHSPPHPDVRMLRRWQSESSKSPFIHVPRCDIESNQLSQRAAGAGTLSRHPWPETVTGGLCLVFYSPHNHTIGFELGLTKRCRVCSHQNRTRPEGMNSLQIV